jgi:hypothetical protein
MCAFYVLKIGDFYTCRLSPTSVADPDPGSGAFFYLWIRDWFQDGKKFRSRIKDPV